MPAKKVLIQTVGGSPIPLAKSISEQTPHFIYWIPSTTTRPDCDALLAEVKRLVPYATVKIFPTDNHNDLMHCYRSCLEVLNDIKNLGLDHEDIVADPTGGTKIMSAALILAAAELGLTVAYVGGEERTKDGKGVVINGSEKMYYSAHPYDIIARFDKESFCNNFNAYRFEAAVADCIAIKSKGSQNLKRLAGALEKITVGYRDWDLFRYDTCANALGKGLDDLRRLSVEEPAVTDRLGAFIRRVAENLDHLQRLPKLGLVWEYVREVTANAVRRGEEGRYDDAVARLYRALEMAGQAEIYKLHGESTTNFPVHLLDAQTQADVRNKIKKTKTVDLGSYDTFNYLARIGNEVGQKYITKNDEIRAILQNRNDSILAHGIIALDKGKYEKLLYIFRELFGVDYEKIRFAKIDIENLLSLGID
jgi:CRISPR-associated protein (TIGR02710 family)